MVKKRSTVVRASQYTALAQMLPTRRKKTLAPDDDKVLQASRVFEHTLWTNFDESNADACLSLLLATGQYGHVFDNLAGDRSRVLREWSRMVKVVSRDAALCDLSYSELYSRLYLHFNAHHSNVLLLAAIIHAAWMYNGPALLLTLKKVEGEVTEVANAFLHDGHGVGTIALNGKMASPMSVDALAGAWISKTKHHSLNDCALLR